MSLVLVGISHHQAPVELRERAALDRTRAAELARALAGDHGEAVCLSTCNRTELYLADESADAAEEKAEAALLALESELGPALYRLRDEAAALHLFRVAAGLDSMIPGEGEILGQVRAAYEAGATGPLLDRLFRQALQAGRKARAADGDRREPGVGFVGRGGARRAGVRRPATDRSVLVVGAGKIGELGDPEPRFARARRSRSSPTAPASARRSSRNASAARPCRSTRIEDELARADVVLSSTSAPGWVLTREQVERTLPARKGRPLFLIDLAVPRDLDPADPRARRLLPLRHRRPRGGRRGDARRPAPRGRARRDDRRRGGGAVPRVAGVARVVPAITSLRARAEEIRDAELRRAKLNDAERRAAESVTAAVLNKLLHLPTIRMKQAAAAADGVIYADAVRHLFGLEDER